MFQRLRHPERDVSKKDYFHTVLTFTLISFFLRLDLCLTTYCRCRGLMLHLITRIDTYTLGRAPRDQCFSTAGPWHQLYRAARDSPAIDN